MAAGATAAGSTVRSATIGEVINRLVAKGLVERTGNDADRRARVLRLTPEGADIFQRLLPTVSDLRAAILGNLAPGEHTTFLTLLKRAIC